MRGKYESEITETVKGVMDTIKTILTTNKDRFIQAHTTMMMSGWFMQNGSVSLIGGGLDHVIHDASDRQRLNNTGVVYGYQTRDIERFDVELSKASNLIRTLVGSKYTPVVTFHIFQAAPDVESFPMHTDPSDVILYMLYGSKDVTTPNGTVTINEGEFLHIPAHIPHQIENLSNNMMVSVGIEHYGYNINRRHVKRDLALASLTSPKDPSLYQNTWTADPSPKPDGNDRTS